MPWRVFEEEWRRFDEWYERNRPIYESEVAALRALLEELGVDPARSVEVGVGSGRFASRLGVAFGVDPALPLLRLARARGVEAVQGVAEALPVRRGLEAALFIVTLCFLDEPLAALREAARVARWVVSCIVPRGSPWGRLYEARRGASPFYRYARFYTLEELKAMYRGAGMDPGPCVSTLYAPPPGPSSPEEPRPGCSEGAGFVCLAARPRPIRSSTA